MTKPRIARIQRIFIRGIRAIRMARLLLSLMMFWCIASRGAKSADVATPLLKADTPVDWWFVFKFNAESFPGCGGAQRSCPFGGCG